MASPVRCGACGAPCSPSARFCQDCGTRLERSVPLDAAPAAERRQLTVVFCDLVGSTRLSERLDPEDLRDVMRAYHQACEHVVGRFGGHVAQYLGDGVLAYFGYPLAHEDDAQRAVHAGLEVLREIGAFPLSLAGLHEPLETRIGIHTGLVVVGALADVGRPGSLAIGEAPNVAARLQQMAAPNQVLISETTHRLVHEYFRFEALGPKQLKGVSDPVQVYRAVGETGLQTRFDAAVRAGLIPLVGRVNEVALLLERWKQVVAGNGQVALLWGEPGIGKSRLLLALRERLRDEPHLSVECRCSAYHPNSTLYPLIEYLKRLAGFQRDDPAGTRLEKLANALAAYRFRAADALPLLASLLSLPPREGMLALAMTPQAQKQRTLETLVGWLLDTAERQPVVLELEDLHWADPSTLELLDLVIERSVSAPVYILLTTREQSLLSRWATQPHVGCVRLDRLERSEIARLIGELSGGRTLPAELLDRIASKTDGIPLFVEELTKMVLESDGAANGSPLPDLTIPASLQDSLMARLDGLPGARGVAQLGATLGREFSYGLMRAVCPLDETVLQHGLGTLVDADLLRREERDGETRYAFKHALVQDAAYASLLKSKRQQFHYWIAQKLEDEFSEITETQPELVAHHFTRSGAIDRSLPYWQRAGQRALERSAYVEAVNHFTTALDLAAKMPESKARNALELGLRSLLGVALVATQGYASENVERNYSQAETLCRSLGDAPHLFPSLYGLWTYQMLRNQREHSFDLAARLEQLARAPEHRFMAASVRGVTLYWSGAFGEAEARLRTALGLFEPGYHQQLAPILGDDATLLAHLYRAWSLVELGRFAETRTALRALPLPASGASPYVEVTALVFEMVACLNMCAMDQTRTLAEKVIALASEYQLPFFLAAATCGYGATLVHEGSPKAGIEKIREGLRIFELTGTATSRGYWLAQVAEGFLADGNAPEGLVSVDEAWSASRTGLGRYNVVDLQRLRGDLLVLGGEDQAGAERCLRAALTDAEAQGARRQGLVAATSLGRLLACQGRRAEALPLVAEWAAPFGEDLDAPAIAAARQLVAALG